jgi:hypothetical protein
VPAIRQASFAGGEISSSLYGRSDLAKYGSSARTLRNFFVTRQGEAVSRPGTIGCGTVKNSASGPVRLIPFIYSDTAAFALEFGAGYIRFWKNGAPVLSTGVPYEVSTPYTIAEVTRLKFAQVGAVLALTHPAHPPAELRYFSDTSWTYTAINFDRPQSGGGGGSIYLLEFLPVADSTHFAKEWTWAIGEVWKDSRGNPYEKKATVLGYGGFPYYDPWNSGRTYQIGTFVKSDGTDGGTAGQFYRSLGNNNLNNLLSDAAWWVHDTSPHTSPVPIQLDVLPSQVVCYPDKPVTVVLNNNYGNALVDPNFLGYRIYRGRGGLLGLLGEAKYNTFTFVDDGATPDYAQQPPQGTNPFKFFDSNGTLTSTEYPACVAHFEERRVFARTDNRPGFIWMSNVGDYANFDSRRIPLADEALQFELASRRVEEIRSVVGVGPRLLALTNSAPWVVGDDSGPVTFDNLSAKMQSEGGANWVDPLVVDGVALFARSKGSGVRAVSFDIQRQGLAGVDLSIMASHLFRARKIVDWCYAEDPWGLILAVLDNGQMAVLTYVKDQDVWAWTHWDTNGVIESICTVPEGLEDAIYVTVRRGASNTRYVERFANRTTGQVGGTYVCLDCAATYSGSPTTTPGSFTLLNGQSVSVVADGISVGPRTVSSNVVTLDVAAFNVVVGLPFVADMELLDPALQGAEVRHLPKQLKRVHVELENSIGLKVGPDINHLTTWKERRVADSYGPLPLFSGVATIDVTGSWDGTGRVFIRQDQPFPMTVVSVTREVELASS